MGTKQGKRGSGVSGMRAISTSGTVADTADTTYRDAATVDVTTESAAAIRSASAPRATAGAVRVERLILHGLNNRAEAIQLVDEPAVLTGESERFFALHIASAAERAEWRARFADPNGEVAALCLALLSGHEQFVAASRQLALRLYEQMRPRTIAPGDFVAATYSDGENRRHIALLKLDPDQRLARTFTSSGGRTRVSIAAAQNLLPEMHHLQKCALIDFGSDSAGFDVTLLDNQAGPHSEGVAAFFYRGFLDTDLEPSSRHCTRTFLRCCDSWLAGYRDVLSPAELMLFYEIRRAYLSPPARALVLNRFAASALPAHPELAEELHQRLVGALSAAGYAEGGGAPVHAFEIHAAVAGSVTDRRILELDGGVRLIIPADGPELIRVDSERTAENKVRIVIESLTLKEVSDR